MIQQFILSIDQGTTGSTALVVDRAGKILASVNREFPNYFPKPGWVEQDAREIWHSVQVVTGIALEQAGIGHGDIAAIGITNQRETTILWDRKTGEPVHRAIVWQCRRTASFCEELKAAGHERTFASKTGLVLDPYFSGTKIRWILDHVPGLRERAANGEIAFGTVDCWLAWKLTGRHVTDFTNASRTLLYNIAANHWDDELLGILDVPRQILPEVKPCRATFGVTRPENFGGREVPILGMAGDQQAALCGHFGFEPGACKNTYGTGSFVVANVGRTFRGPAGGLLTTLAAGADGRPVYALEGSIFTSGSAVQYLRDQLQFIASAAETEAIANSVPDTAGVVVVPAFVGLGSPHWDANARAAILGLTRGASRAHIVRATLEAVAFQVKDVMEAMSREGGLSLTSLAVDGGMIANRFLMQFQADVLGLPVIQRSVKETTGFGAALLAGLEAGLMELEEVRHSVTIEREYLPAMSADEREFRSDRWRKAVRAVRDFGN